MTHSRPFRFGVQGFGFTTGDQWLAMVRRIEDLGYSTYLALDHFVRGLEPVAALAAAAAVTTRLRVGSIVFDNDFRHPALLAKSVATIDFISNGRFEFGIGAGWLKEEYDQTGIPFDPAGVRIDRMVEALHLMKQAFVEERTTFHGNHYAVTGMISTPKPVQHPHPPIMIGGGSKRILSIAAREANIVSITTRALPDGTKDFPDMTAAATQRKIDWVREAAGDRLPGIELNVMTSNVVVTDDRQAAAERLAGTFGISPAEVLDSPIALIGTVDEIVDQVQERRERYGFSYITIRSESMDDLAPVVARLAGT